MSDSPLLTPKDPPPNKVISQLAQGFQKQSQEVGEKGSDNKLQGWKDRLQKIREQKTQPKEQTITDPKEEELKAEEKELKKMFAPKSIDIAGKHSAQNVFEQKKMKRLEDLEVENYLDEDLLISDDKEEKKEEKPKTGIQRPGLRKPGSALGAPATQNALTAKVAQNKEIQEAIKDAQKEKLMKKNEEVKERLSLKQAEAKAQPQRTTLAKQQAAQKEAAEKAKLDSAEAKLNAQSATPPQTKQEPTPPATSAQNTSANASGGKIGLKKIGQGASDTQPGVKPGASGLQRAQTARPQLAKEEKKEEEIHPPPATTGLVKKGTIGGGLKGPSAAVGSALKSKLGGLATQKPTVETQKQMPVVEESDEKLSSPRKIPTTAGQRTQSPSKVVAQRQQSPSKLQSQLTKKEPTHQATHQNPIIEATSQSLQQKILNDQQNEAAQSFGGVSQVEFKKLETELRKKKEEVYSLQMEVKSLSTKMSDLQTEHANKLETLQTEYESKFLELEQKLQDSSQLNEAKSQNEQKIQELILTHRSEIESLQKSKAEAQGKLEQQISQLNQQKQTAENQYKEAKQSLDQITKEKNQLQIEVDAKNIDIETLQLEMDALKDEKEELIQQIQMNSESQNEDVTKLMTQDELRNQNQKLRLAVTTLQMNFDGEKAKLVTKIKELQEKADQVEEYEKKIEDMDLLLEEVELKEKEIADMQEKLDECLEYEKMVEEMASDLLKKEEENEQMLEKIIELEEINAVQEELNENQDQYVKELLNDIANKDSELFEMQQNKEQVEEMVLEQDEQLNKYKDKFKEINEKNKLLNDELQGAYQTGDSQLRISQLLEKQNHLLAKLREASKKDLELIGQKIDYQQEKLKMKVIEEFIPLRLADQTKLDSLEKIQSLNKSRNKGLLLIRGICEKHLNESREMFEENAQWIQYVTFLVALCEHIAKFIDVANRIMYCTCKMSIQKYSDVTKNLAWNRFLSANQFFDKVIELIQEESMSISFDISAFIQTIKSLTDLLANIETKYYEIESSESPEEAAIKLQEKQKDIKNCSKLNLRNQCLKIAIGVISIGNLTSENSFESLQKCKLIYWRLLDIILKIDNMEVSDNGQQYLNLGDLNTDKKLEQKFDLIRIIWEAQGIEAQAEAQVRDWSSVLEAVEKDITALNNDFKFKKLVAYIDDQYKDQSIQIDDLYQKGWDSKGPWNMIASKIRSDLEEADQMKEKIEQLHEKQKESSLHNLGLKREKEELAIVVKSLEVKLGDAMTKSEKAQVLEMEKKRFMDKETLYMQQLEQAKKQIEELREKEKTLKEQNTELETNLQNAGSRGSIQGNKFGRQVTSTTNAQARQQRTSQYFQKLATSSLVGKRDSMNSGMGGMTRQSSSSASNNELQKQLQMNEEIFTSVIKELQKDRMMLRGKETLERLNQLEKKEGAFNQYLQKQRERKDILMRISMEEQQKLEDANQNLNGLKSKVKKEMAMLQVIDLTQPKKNVLLEKEILERQQIGQEKINYMIVKAKNQVGEVFKTLFPKDSTLNLQPISRPQLPSDAKPSSVRIGSLKFASAFAGNKVINLEMKEIQELKQSLALFS